MPVLAALILAEGWPPATEVVAPIGRGALPAAAPPGCAVLDLPLGDRDTDLAAMLRSVLAPNGAARPAVNGFSGHAPPHYLFVQDGTWRHEPGTLDELRRHGDLCIVVNESAGWRRNDRWSFTRWVASLPGAELLETGDHRTVFALAALRPRPEVADGAPWPIAGLRASRNDWAFPRLSDGDPRTRWEACPQVGEDELQADLGSLRPIAAVVATLGRYPLDFPRDLRVELSTDGESWRHVFEGVPLAEAIEGALREPKALPLRFATPGESARYVRLRRVGRDEQWCWSVAELRVHRPG